MGLQATYETELTLEDVERKLKGSQKFKVNHSTDDLKLMLYPNCKQNVKIQVLGKGICKIWCRDLEQLHEVEDLLNAVLRDDVSPKPFGKAKNVRRMGSGPAYYETQEEVVERLIRDPCATAIRNLDAELSDYPAGSEEKIELLLAAAEAASHFLGSPSIHAFERAVEAETDREAARIMVEVASPALTNFASYFLFLLREHKDVVLTALQQVNTGGDATKR